MILVGEKAKMASPGTEHSIEQDACDYCHRRIIACPVHPGCLVHESGCHVCQWPASSTVAARKEETGG